MIYSDTKLQKMVLLVNYLCLLALIGVLVFALMVQFVLQELPCPLCLLQRVGYLIISVGFLFNIRFGLKPSHYAISLLGALFTAFVAMRQIALHIVPGTGDYGSSILGLHLYTWSFMGAVIYLLVITILLGLDKQYDKTNTPPPTHTNGFSQLMLAMVLTLAFVNVIAVLGQCGLEKCPSDPIAAFSID